MLDRVIVSPIKTLGRVLLTEGFDPGSALSLQGMLLRLDLDLDFLPVLSEFFFNWLAFCYESRFLSLEGVNIYFPRPGSFPLILDLLIYRLDLVLKFLTFSVRNLIFSSHASMSS